MKKRKILTNILASTAIGSAIAVAAVAQACSSRNTNTPIDPDNPDVSTIINAVNELSIYTTSTELSNLATQILSGFNVRVDELSVGSTVSTLSFDSIGVNNISVNADNFTITILDINGTTSLGDNLEGNPAFQINNVNGALTVVDGSFLNIQLVNTQIITTIIANTLNQFSNYQGQPFLNGTLAQRVIAAMIVNINGIAPGESYTLNTLALDVNGSSTPVRDGSNYTVEISVINGTATNDTTSDAVNLTGNLVIVFSAPTSSSVQVTSVMNFGIQANNTALELIFTNLDGFTINNAVLSPNEISIINALGNAVNELGIGVVNPDNTVDSTFDTLADGTALSLGFNGLDPVISELVDNQFSVAIPLLTATAASAGSATNPQYEGLEAKFTSTTSFSISFTFEGGIITDIVIPEGIITRVAPSFTLSEAQLQTAIEDTVLNLISTDENNLTAFDTSVSNNVVSSSDLSLYSFVNYISKISSLSTRYTQGIFFRTPSFTFNSISAENAVIQFDASTSAAGFNVGTGGRESGWSRTPSGQVPAPDERGLVSNYALQRSFVVNIFGTQNNPILLFNTNQTFDYVRSTFNTIISLFDPTDQSTFLYPDVPLYQSYRTALNDFIFSINGNIVSRLGRSSARLFDSLTITNNVYTGIVNSVVGDENITNSPISGDLMIVADYDPLTRELLVRSDGVSGLVVG